MNDTPESTIPRPKSLQQIRASVAPAETQAIDPYLDEIFRIVLDLGATDLHLSEKSAPVLRLARTCVQIKSAKGILSENANTEVWTRVRDSLLKEGGLNDELPRGGNVNADDLFDFNYGPHRLRVSRYRCDGEECFTIRFQPSKIITLKETGIRDEVVKGLTSTEPGLTLISGGMCGGKSTTLAGLLDYFNGSADFNIRILERAIEFKHEPRYSIIRSQRVGGPRPDVENMHDAVEASLGQDINIIAIGEIRDLEDIQAAIKTANLNLVTFGTIHASTALRTISRVINDYPEQDREGARASLRRSIKTIICQRLRVVPNADAAIRVNSAGTVVLEYQAINFHDNEELKKVIFETALIENINFEDLAHRFPENVFQTDRFEQA